MEPSDQAGRESFAVVAVVVVVVAALVQLDRALNLFRLFYSNSRGEWISWSRVFSVIGDSTLKSG